jgi:lycopene cyclase domain-containing protein
MAACASSLAAMAKDKGVEFKLNAEVTGFEFEDSRVSKICTPEGCDEVSGVVASADYHHVEQRLLPKKFRLYDESFWEDQAMSPSVLLFYVGLSKQFPELLHHTFFFDSGLEKHLSEVFETRVMPPDPTFYVSATARSDDNVGPVGGESLFILVPIPYAAKDKSEVDTKEIRERIWELVLRRMEAKCGPMKDSIVFYKDYGPNDYVKDFHSFRGNAFGHANLLFQSLVFKPSMDSKLDNLVFAGHLTNPGPGVPPSLVSGIVAAGLLESKLLNGPAMSWWPLFVAIIACILVWKMSLAPPWDDMKKSQAECNRLMHAHGRTYFAAASLMGEQRFSDIAAMYAIFRVADDFVDNYGSPKARYDALAKFEVKFWRNWASGVGVYSDHPCLPAVIEASRRLQHDRSLFERFFKSMRYDAQSRVQCRTWEETYEYMDGSAAVIGDFMMPLLMPNGTFEEREKALPHAQDLGRAFQLTNFIRDIDEDLDLKRQYIPEEFCQKFGVNLEKRDASQEGFPELIKHCLSLADDLYTSADIGITMLPFDVAPMIAAASRMYHAIHGALRARQYNIHAGRVKVGFWAKMSLLRGHVNRKQVALLFSREISARLASWAKFRAPTLLFLAVTYGVCEVVEHPTCSYALFLVVFVVAPLVVAVKVARDNVISEKIWKAACKWTGVLCLMAVVYTTPWDNYLVAHGAWGYNAANGDEDSRVIAVIGYVPVEEYCFFVLQSALVAAVWLGATKGETSQPPPTPAVRTLKGPLVLAAMGVMELLSLYGLAYGSPKAFYICIITAWSLPVLMVQWGYGSECLMAQRRTWIPIVIACWTYLCIIDRWAIRQGIWFIAHPFSLPRLGWQILPLEEAWFFLVTTVMCTWTLQLVITIETLEYPFVVSLGHVHRWATGADVHRAFIPDRGVGKGPSWSLDPKNVDDKFGKLARVIMTMPSEQQHSLGALAMAGAALVLGRNLSEQGQVVLVCTTTVLFGLPHGALDLVVAEWYAHAHKSQLELGGFLPRYLGGMFGTLLLWWFAPGPSLLMFVLASIAHFGEGDVQANLGKTKKGMIWAAEIFARGGIILFPVQWHPHQVAWVFTCLIGYLFLFVNSPPAPCC